MAIAGPPPPTAAFVVGEVCKNWQDGKPVVPTPSLAVQFETLTNYHAQHGYRLHSFQIHRFAPGPGILHESLVAVFERQERAA